MQTIKCPACAKHLSHHESVAGKVVTCPECSTKMRVPPLPPRSPIEPKWFIARNQKKTGPYTLLNLKQQAESGYLFPTDMVLADGGKQWFPAESLGGIFRTALSPETQAAQEQPKATLEPIRLLETASNLAKHWGIRGMHAFRRQPWLASGVTGGVVVVLILIAMTVTSRSPANGQQASLKKEYYPSRNSNVKADLKPHDTNPPSEEKNTEAAEVLDDPVKQGKKAPEAPSVELLGDTRKHSKQPLEQKRKELLREMSVRVDSELTELYDQEDQCVEKGKKLAERRNDYSNVDPFDARALAASNAYRKELVDLLKHVTAIRDKIDEKVWYAKQQQRRILQKHPEPGDPSFEEYKGQLYTQDELRTAKQFEATHASPRNVADAQIKSLLEKRTILNATYEKTNENIGQNGIVHVYYRVDLTVKGKYLENEPIYVVVFKQKDSWHASPQVMWGDRGANALPPAAPNFGRPPWGGVNAIILRPGQDFSIGRPKTRYSETDGTGDRQAQPD